MAADQSTRKAVRLRISGQVQGVWFRGWTLEVARGLDLDGWVRNRIDGTVEVLAVGAPDCVDRLIAACHDGPPAAAVSGVEVTPAEGIVATGFRQMPTV